ncbi:hypothetical protein IP88_05905, partial [alpha proteobacterium AAP81b]
GEAGAAGSPADEPVTGEAPRATVDGGDLTPAPPAAIDYRAKLGSARDLVDADADRATAVARQMLGAA